MNSIIPKMTNPLGRHWHQPSSNDMLFDEDCVIMSKDEYTQLVNYSATLPSGTYEGKMWKGLQGYRDMFGKIVGTKWFLFWYYDVEDKDQIGIETREILIVD